MKCAMMEIQRVEMVARVFVRRNLDSCANYLERYQHLSYANPVLKAAHHVCSKM
jgi:hypothetical protein